MDKILTISIAAYNAEHDIGRCLESLIALGMPNYLDIIVVNDGSKDRTKEIVEHYIQEHGNFIRLINKKNGGHGSTINTSIQLAVGKYYKILDSDDWVETENLKKLVEYLVQNDVDLVLNPYHEVSYLNHTDRKLLTPIKNGVEYEKIYNIEDSNENGRITPFMHSLTYKTSCIKSMGPIIDENCFYVDMEYCIFPLIYIKNFVCLAFPVYEYLLGSQTQSVSMENMIKRREQHLKVTKRIIHFGNTNESKMKASIREMVMLRIKYAVYQQYRIYLCMASKTAGREMKEFDSWLKGQNFDLYKGPHGKQMKLISLIRMSNFKLYSPVAHIAKRVIGVQKIDE